MISLILKEEEHGKAVQCNAAFTIYMICSLGHRFHVIIPLTFSSVTKMQWKDEGRVKNTHVLWRHLVVNNDSVICYIDRFRPCCCCLEGSTLSNWLFLLSNEHRDFVYMYMYIPQPSS